MKPEGSLPHSQVLATCPYPEPDQSSPCPHTHFLKAHRNIILSSRPGSSKASVSPQGSPTTTLDTPILSPYMLYAPPISFSI